MKVKLLRRAFCVVMCVVILACSSVNAFGAELFYDQYSYVWANRTNSYVTITWINVNVPTTSNGITASDVNDGMYIWVSGTSSSSLSAVSPQQAAAVSATPATLTTMPSTGYILHSIPSESFWINLFPLTLDHRLIGGQSVLYTTTGYQVSEGTDGGIHPICGQSIARAECFYNPNHEAYFTVFHNWTNTVAHEVGHALGFGHESSSSSIMYGSGKTQAVALSLTDKMNYVLKY